jgi:hypothetical protein
MEFPVMWVRAFVVWCLILVVEVMHGIVRTLWLVPLVGDLRSRQIGVVTGSLLILGIACLAIRWIATQSARQRLAVGVAWLAGMLAAEVLLARLAFGFPWSRIAEDFDPTQGGFLAFGMLVLAAAPTLAFRWRGG